MLIGKGYYDTRREEHFAGHHSGGGGLRVDERRGGGGGRSRAGAAAAAGGVGLHSAAVLEIGAMVLQNMFSALSFLHYRRDDDFVDRLSYFYSSSFLLMMAMLVSFKQFGGRPLECWVPAQFTPSWEAYAEMYCWAQNTYWVPFEAYIPQKIEDREYRQISYYQWVPFFLLIEAFLFYIPCLIWRLMNDKSGLRINDIVTAASSKENIDPDVRARIIGSLSKHLEASLKYQHSTNSRATYTLHRVFRCFNVRYYESYVTGLYLVTKVFYVVNILINLLLINKFLETDSYDKGLGYGFGVLMDLWAGKTWADSGKFPRVTLCDFEIRVLGNIQRHSVQCVLVINIFNEKIFILTWLWYTLLFAFTVMGALYWFSISLFHRDRLRFIMRHLELTDDPETFRRERKGQVEHFLRTYVKVDGVFVLRMVAAHSGVMFCTELTEALWQRYLKQQMDGTSDVHIDSKEEVTAIGDPESGRRLLNRRLNSVISLRSRTVEPTSGMLGVGPSQQQTVPHLNFVPVRPPTLANVGAHSVSYPASRANKLPPPPPPTPGSRPMSAAQSTALPSPTIPHAVSAMALLPDTAATPPSCVGKSITVVPPVQQQNITSDIDETLLQQPALPSAPTIPTTDQRLSM